MRALRARFHSLFCMPMLIVPAGDYASCGGSNFMRVDAGLARGKVDVVSRVDCERGERFRVRIGCVRAKGELNALRANVLASMRSAI